MSAVIEDRVIEQAFREDTIMVAETVIAHLNETISGEGTPVIRRIPLRLLNVALADPGPGYQREPNLNRVRKIARAWDWGMYEPLIVSERKDGPRAGQLFIVDGQHRYLAALENFPEWQELPALVLPMTMEEEARRFARQGENRTGVNTRDLFRARLEANDPAAHDIVAVLAAAGWRISFNQTRSGSTIQAVNAVQNIYNHFGRELLALTLHVINSTYPESMEMRTDNRLITGIAHFLFHFPVVKVNLLIEKLSRPEAHPRRLLQNSALYATGSGGGGGAKGASAVSRAILDQYNKNTSANRLDWDLKKYRELPAKKKGKAQS